MKLEIPAQLRGIDAAPVMSVAIAIRREFEDDFDALGNEHLDLISPILRVGGEIGTFGEDRIEKVEVSDRRAVCDLVIDRRKWGDMSDKQISDLLRPRIVDALLLLLRESKVDPIPDFLLAQNDQAEQGEPPGA